MAVWRPWLSWSRTTERETWWQHSVLVAKAAAVLRSRHDGRLRGTGARGLGCGGGCVGWRQLLLRNWRCPRRLHWRPACEPSIDVVVRRLLLPTAPLLAGNGGTGGSLFLANSSIWWDVQTALDGRPFMVHMFPFVSTDPVVHPLQNGPSVQSIAYCLLGRKNKLLFFLTPFPGDIFAGKSEFC